MSQKVLVLKDPDNNPTEVVKVYKEYFDLSPMKKVELLDMLQVWINQERTKLDISKLMN